MHFFFLKVQIKFLSSPMKVEFLNLIQNYQDYKDLTTP